MVILKCDKCGIDNQTAFEVKHFRVEKHVAGTNYNLFWEFHLCEQCSELLRDNLVKFENEKVSRAVDAKASEIPA